MPWNRLSQAWQMLVDKHSNTQFVLHRKHNNLCYKDHPLNFAYKTNCCLLSIIWSAQTQCLCTIYIFLTPKLVVCIICNYCALKGQCCFYSASVCNILTRQMAMSIRSLTITFHKLLTHCKHPLMEGTITCHEYFQPYTLWHEFRLLP